MNERAATQLALQTAKLRPTPVRSEVLAILQQAKGPLEAREIISRLHDHTGPVTVYRTLNTLVRKSVIHRVRSANRVWLYAISNAKISPAHQHPHFICDDCGRVECLKHIELPPDFPSSLNMDRRYIVAYSEVMLHGTCARCH